MTPDVVASIAKQRGFTKQGRTNFVRDVNDVIQLVNVQKSNFSDSWYINFALWPKVFGAPDRVAEHLFPLRGRIENVLDLSEDASAGDLDHFFDVIGERFSSLESLRSCLSRGVLSGMYVKADLKALLAR